MIWIRRFLAVFLAIIFIVVFILAMVLHSFNGTALSSDFYVEQLREADVYQFAMNDLLTAAIDEAKAADVGGLPGNFEENPLARLGLSTQEIVDAANQAVPPEWVQEQVEGALGQGVGYFSGKQAHFQITIRGGERATEVAKVTKNLFVKSDTYTVLFDEVITPEIDKALAEEGALPLGVDLTAAQLTDSAKAVATKEWVDAQVIMVLDELTPYFTGETNSFEVRILLADRIPIALEEIKRILRESDAYDLLYDEVIIPRVLDILGRGLELPYGIQITEQEVTDALEAVAPREWVQEQVEMVIDLAGPYLVGTQDRLVVVIDLRENKADALVVIDRLARDHLEALVRVLPTCTSLQQLSGFSAGSRTPPPCIPAGFNPLAFIDQFNLGITSQVAQAMNTQVPDTITFTDSNLRQALIDAGSDEGVQLIDDVREVVSQGWTYTDEDLRQDLVENVEGDPLRVLEDVRTALREGWTYTDEDLRQDIRDNMNASDAEDTLDTIDTAREWLGRVGLFRWLAFLAAALLLIAIGFLGGRRWWSRLAWAMIVLAIASLALFIVTGPLYSALVSPELADLRIKETEDLAGVEFLLVDKVFSIAISAVDGVFSGLSILNLVITVVAWVLFFLALAWPTRLMAPVRARVPKRHRTPPSPNAPSQQKGPAAKS